MYSPYRPPVDRHPSRAAERTETPPPPRGWLTGLCPSVFPPRFVMMAGSFAACWCIGPMTTGAGPVGFRLEGRWLVDIAPIYTSDNCKFAYQLRWSLTLFWRSPPTSDEWLSTLRSATKADGIRILQHRFGRNDCSLFLVSTRPDVAPSKILWSVKGRLQHLLGNQTSRAFQRNYDLQSIGSTRGEKVETYVAAQLKQHPPANHRMLGLFDDLQIVNPEVDLLQPRFTAHGRFVCNLHLVFVHDGRWSETRKEVWVAVREMIRKASSAKGHLLSRVGIVPDHLHMTLGIGPDDKPQDVALSYMNNIAFVHGMKPVFMHGCFMAGFGEYDLGAIRDV